MRKSTPGKKERRKTHKEINVFDKKKRIDYQLINYKKIILD